MSQQQQQQQQQDLNQLFAKRSYKRAGLEVLFDVSHAGHRKLVIQSLCSSGSEFTWGGQYVHFITFCQKAQWNVCGTLFLFMSPAMEFLITNVTTRPLLMSFVKDNYKLGGMAKASMKSWLCVVWVYCTVTHASFYTLRLTRTVCVRKNPGPCFIIDVLLEAE